jgi:ABC-2 type transport system ATP-binding protein
MHDVPFLDIRHITKTFGTRNALNHVSFEIKHGEVVALLGVNGAGKTTLSSIIASLHPASSGDILCNGTSIYHNISNYRRMIGYCPQRPNLNSFLTVYQNLYYAGCYYGLPLKELEERITYVTHQFCLQNYLTAKPAHLSGGYKQRATIARSLIHNPRLVILDEPTVALDPQIRYKLWEAIVNLKQSGIAVLMTTHYIEEAEALADRICLLSQGKVLLIDTPKNLIATFQKGKLEEVFLQLTQEETAL